MAQVNGPHAVPRRTEKFDTALICLYVSLLFPRTGHSAGRGKGTAADGSVDMSALVAKSQSNGVFGQGLAGHIPGRSLPHTLLSGQACPTPALSYLSPREE